MMVLSMITSHLWLSYCRKDGNGSIVAAMIFMYHVINVTFDLITGGSINMKRFIKEYANYQKETISSYELMREDIKVKALNRIDNILKASEKGLITIDESMKSIANVLSE